MDFIKFLYEQHEFSLKTFGPGSRTPGVLDHIRKELNEIEEFPDDLEEWADLILLAFDGAMRREFKPEDILNTVRDKFIKNTTRQWPDWRECDPNLAIEHI